MSRGVRLKRDPLVPGTHASAEGSGFSLIPVPLALG